jgi:hypothetical protein
MLAASGTILLSVRREDFVVMAADRRWVSAKSWGDLPKIVLHPRLPLAFSTGGLTFLDGCETPRHIWRATRRIPGLEAPDLPCVMRCLKEELRGRVKKVRRADPYPLPVPLRLVIVTVALWRRGRAHLAVLQLTDGEREESRPDFFHYPPCLDVFYSRYPGPGTIYGDGISDPGELAEHLRAVVAAGIAEEARIHGGRNQHCGGQVDVALVDVRGAHRVDL